MATSDEKVEKEGKGIRDIIIGLAVTVIGGLIVVYWTKSTPKPILSYHMTPAVSFRSDNTAVALQSVGIINRGDIPAHDIHVLVKFSENITVKGLEAKFSSGDLDQLVKTQSKQQNAELMLGSLLPGESVNITFLLSSLPANNPEVHIRSSEVQGSELSLKDDRPSQFRTYLDKFLAIGFVAELIVILLAFSFWRRVGRLHSHSMPVPNNTAFLLLHQNRVDDALRIFTKTMDAQGAEAIMLSNIALCYGLKGDVANADCFFRASKFYAIGDHEKAVWEFNHAIYSFQSKKIKEGETHLKEALKLSREQITKYVEYSEVLRLSRSQSVETDAAVKDALIG